MVDVAATGIDLWLVLNLNWMNKWTDNYSFIVIFLVNALHFCHTFLLPQSA